MDFEIQIFLRFEMYVLSCRRVIAVKVCSEQEDFRKKLNNIVGNFHFEWKFLHFPHVILLNPIYSIRFVRTVHVRRHTVDTKRRRPRQW